MEVLAQKRDPIEGALESLIKIVGRYIGDAGWGWRKLRDPDKRYRIGLGISVGIAVIAWFLRREILHLQLPAPVLNYALLAALLLSPILYLQIIGGPMKQMAQGFRESFMGIGFVGRDKKPPMLLHHQEKEKLLTMRFRSNIPLEKWRSEQGILETALDVTITRIDPSKSKRVVEIGAISSAYKIPEDIHWEESFASEKSSVVVLGESALGPVTVDLNRNPHILAGGETGSGKSVLLRLILNQLIRKNARVFMVDFKGGVEFGIQYERFGPVVTEHEQALEMFEMLVVENKARLETFRSAEVKNIDEYNRKTGANLCRCAVVIDEVAEMTDRTGCSKETKAILEQIEGKVSTLARLARATGINLFLGTQRPDAKVVTGQIKTNVPVRISGRFADNAASEIVLGNTQATKLPDIKGRFLFKAGPDTVQFQAYYFDDDTMLPKTDMSPGDLLTESEGSVAPKLSLVKEPEDYLRDELDDDDLFEEEDPEEGACTKEVLDLNFDFKD